ncbi:MAG: hypothetical protein SGJ18_00285 [Pseudomonadota bacterium]|nr:hypothetical protein [Pseudomonadota bacterium]
MADQKPKIGKKGGAKRVAQKIAAMRREPLSKNIFDIIEKANQSPKSVPNKKSAKPKSDLDI